jgi:MoxR-like ATPase
MNPGEAPALAPIIPTLQAGGPVAATLAHLRREAARVVVGQEALLDGLCLGLLARGHLLLEGPPGVAKTLAVKVFARILGLDFQRVQGSPDLLPSDIAGGNILGPDGGFRFRPGPLFAAVVLVDEINRMPPRTQAALLEAMQERQVTVDRAAYPLPPSFTVFATQNPVEYEGTYPLPEAQLDRFLMKLPVGYPTLEGELAILAQPPDPARLLDALVPLPAGALAAAQAAIEAVRAEPPLVAYVAALARQTRDWPSIQLGASPRAAVAVLQMARSLAAAEGRDFTLPDDVKAAVPPVLRHRLRLRPEAEMEGKTPDVALAEVLAAVPVPR